MSSGQRHLVPSAPEACQFLRTHDSAFPKSGDTAERRQVSNPHSGCCIDLVTRYCLARSSRAASLDLRKEDADVLQRLMVKDYHTVSWRIKYAHVCACAPQTRRMDEAHDLPHILPSVKGPEEAHGSIFSSAYLNGPAWRRMLGRRKTRETRVTFP